MFGKEIGLARGALHGLGALVPLDKACLNHLRKNGTDRRARNVEQIAMRSGSEGKLSPTTKSRRHLL